VPKSPLSSHSSSDKVVATGSGIPPSKQKSIEEPQGASKEDAFAALKTAAEMSGMLIAVAFLTGWSYMASYYTTFGLNPLELDFSVPATAAFALHAFRNSGWPLAVFAVPFILFPFSKKLAPMLRSLAAGCIGVLLLLLAAAGSRRGRDLAREDMFETSPRLPTVGFVSKNKVDEPSCLSDGTMDCKLLLHAKGMYYFFIPIRESAGSLNVGMSNLNVYAVPESEITGVHVSPGCGTNDLDRFSKEGCK